MISVEIKSAKLRRNTSPKENVFTSFALSKINKRNRLQIDEGNSSTQFVETKYILCLVGMCFDTP